MSKFNGLVVTWLFVSRIGIKMQFLSVVGFKSSTLTVYCLSSWFIHKQPKTYSNCVSFVDSAIYHDFRDLSIFHPLFGLESQIITLSQNLKKKFFLGHCSFTQLFHDVENLRRKHKIFVKVIQRFWYVQHVGLIFTKIVSQNLDEGNMPRFFQHWRLLPKLQLWLLLVDFLKYYNYMLYIPKSLFDLHKYFRFSPQLFNIMKRLCKRAMI